jgi:hypothetical protein
VRFGFLRFASLRAGLRRKEGAHFAHLYGRAEARALTLVWHVDAIWDGKRQASQAGAACDPYFLVTRTKAKREYGNVYKNAHFGDRCRQRQGSESRKRRALTSRPKAPRAESQELKN